jgi:Domain of unknown function (DUF4173)
MDPSRPGPPPAAAWPPPPPPPRRERQPYLVVRRRGDYRLLAGAVAGGACFDIAARSGLASIGTLAWLTVTAVALLLGRRLRGWASRLLTGAAPVLGVFLFLRSSPWVIVPVTFGVAVLVVTGASLGADNAGLSVTFPGLAARTAVVLGHLGLGPGMLRFPGGFGPEAALRRQAAAVGRGAMLAVPVMVVVGVLLGLADPIFRSWFDLPAIFQHLALVVIGAWVVLGLSRAASAARPVPALPPSPSLGTTEAVVVLGGLCALYATFVAAQFVALSGAGHRILVTQGLTYAQYARSGFFQLLACAAITLVVLLSVRACANASAMLFGLSGLTAVLTLGVVVVAIQRLQLYENVFGLTMLRLACTVSAVWIGTVFLLLGATLVPRGLPLRCLPASVLVSGLIFVGLWSAANPASIVAQTNVRRAEHGRVFDVSQAASLGPDAVPALLDGLRGLPPGQAAELRHAICAQSPWKDGGAAFNLSKADADQATARVCG